MSLKFVPQGTYDGVTSWAIEIDDERIGEITRERPSEFGKRGRAWSRSPDAPYVWTAEIEGTFIPVPQGASLTEAKALVKAKLAKPNPRRRRPMRRNSMGADAMFYALQKARIPWTHFTVAQIRDVMADAAQHGDAKLYERAKAALARRRSR